MDRGEVFDEIVEAYDYVVKGVEKRARENDSRAYGGVVRSSKGKLVESIARRLVELAWSELGGSPGRLELTGSQIKIPLKESYLERVEDDEVRSHIKRNIGDYYYPYRPDVLVLVDGRPELLIECKTYAENAMLKRILIDFSLVRGIYPEIELVLLQLESQLGGDYSSLKERRFGSTSTHTLLSHFDIDMEIVTLLRGERKVDRPIHKPEFFKDLEREDLERALGTIKEKLEPLA